MSEVLDISQEDKELMSKYNITSEASRVYYADGYKYDRLQDAVRYAKLSIEQAQPSADD